MYTLSWTGPMTHVTPPPRRCTCLWRTMLVTWEYTGACSNVEMSSSSFTPRTSISTLQWWVSYVIATVPIFNSCTACVGSWSIILDRMPDCHPVPWSWMHGWSHTWTSLWFASYAGHWCIWLFFKHAIHGCLYNQALVDVRSIGACIKRLCCRP